MHEQISSSKRKEATQHFEDKMTFQTNIPNASQSPGLFPGQANDNFTRLKAIVGANHKFNSAPAADDGYHQIVQILPTDPAIVPNDGTIGQTFTSATLPNGPLCYKDQLNRVFQITPTLPTYAAVNFNGFNPVAIRYGFNIAGVVRTGTGAYTISFTQPLPSNNYVVVGNVQGNFGLLTIASGNYASSVSTTFVKIQVSNLGGSVDSTTITVAIMGG